MIDLLELYDCAENNNIAVDCFDLQSREALSLVDSDGGCYIAINPFALNTTAEEKTKLAHELGHCMTCSFYNQYSPCDVRQRHENRADKWAIKKLIPKDELEKAVNNGYTEAQSLAEFFDVTESFIKKAISFYKYNNLYSF